MIIFSALLIVLSFSAQAKTVLEPSRFKELLEAQSLVQKNIGTTEQAAQALEVNGMQLFAPKIEASAGIERFSIGPYSNRTQPYNKVEGRLNLYNGNQDFNEYKVRRNNAAIAKEERSLHEVELLVKLHEFYLNALGDIASIKILTEAQQINEKNLKLANRRLKAGLVTSTDLLDFNFYNLKLEEQVLNRKIDLSQNESQIRSLLSLEPDEELIFKGELSTFTKPISQNGEGRSQKILELQEEKYAALVGQKNSWWQPKLDFIASHAQLTQREEEYIFAKDRRETILAVEVRFEFDFAQSPWKEQQAQAFEKVASTAHYRQQVIQLENATKHNQKAQALIDEQVEKVIAHQEVAEKHYRQTLDEYARGVKNAPDVLAAGERVVDSKLEMIEILKRKHMTKIEALRLAAY